MAVPAPIQREEHSKRKPYTGIKPVLKVSWDKKTKNDFAHTKNVIDYFIESTYFQDQYTSNTGNYRDLYVFYDAYNNVIPEEYFHYVTNPLNSSKKEHANFPARIRPYNIIRPNVDLYLGEFDRRPKNYTVVVRNEDALNHLEEEIYKRILDAVSQMFINAINQEAGDENLTGVPTQQVEEPPEIQARKLSSYKDERAIWGQEELDRMNEELELDVEFAKQWKDYIIAGECYSYKGIEHGDPVYERVSPLDMDYDKSPDNRYVEDAAWQVRRKYVLPSDVVSQFYDEIDSDEIDDIEAQDATMPFTSTYFNTLFGNSFRREEDLRRTKLVLYHVTWKYYRKIGFLTFKDNLGEEQVIEVDESYKPDKSRGESVEWIWVTEWWEGYRLDSPNIAANPAEGTDDKIFNYFRIRPVPYQRSAINHFSYSKGPYNGFRFSDIHSRNTSIVELSLPYQILYIILHYRLELTIAKSKGKIALLDRGTIPNTKGWDEEKFFYFSEAHGFALLDRFQKGVDRGWNQYQVLDMGLYEHIQNLIKIMEWIRGELDTLMGITPQRKGQTRPTETASGVDAARYQSSIISERMFKSFDEYLRRERKGLLDMSKFRENLGRKYITQNDDMKSIMMIVDPVRYIETDFDVFVTDSTEELNNLNLLKQNLQSIASQSNKPSVLAEIVQARNISKLKQILKKAEAEEQAINQKLEVSKQEAQQQQLETQQAFKQMEFELDKLLQDNEFEHKKEIEHIRGQYQLADTDQPGDTLDPVALEQTLIKRDELLRKQSIEERKLELERDKQKAEREIAQEKIKAEKYKADMQLKVAKENKTQHELKAQKSTASTSKK
jgi:hypothetical protein